MSDLVLLSMAQMRRIEPFFPRPRGLPRADDRRVVSGIVYVIRNGLQWKDAPAGYGPHKTLYNRFIHWSRLGVFARIFTALVAKGGAPQRLMIDATHLKAHRTAASLLQRGSSTHRPHQGRPELQAACCLRRARSPCCPAADRRPAQRPRWRRPAAAHTTAGTRTAGRSRLRQQLVPCCAGHARHQRLHPSTRSRKLPPYDRVLYRQRHRIENAFGRLKDWRRVATRYDHCAHTFFSAICIAATVIFWL